MLDSRSFDFEAFMPGSSIWRVLDWKVIQSVGWMLGFAIWRMLDWWVTQSRCIYARTLNPTCIGLMSCTIWMHLCLVPQSNVHQIVELHKLEWIMHSSVIRRESDWVVAQFWGVYAWFCNPTHVRLKSLTVWRCLNPVQHSDRCQKRVSKNFKPCKACKHSYYSCRPNNSAWKHKNWYILTIWLESDHWHVHAGTINNREL